MEDKKRPNKREEGRKAKKFCESSRSTLISDVSTDDAKLKREAKKKEKEANEDPLDITDLSKKDRERQDKQSQDLVKSDHDLKIIEGAYSLEQDIKSPGGDDVNEQKKGSTDSLPLDENSEYALKFKASLGLGKKVTKEAPDELYKATKRTEKEPLEAYEQKRRKMSEETTDTQVPEKKTGINLKALQSALDNILTALEDKEFEEQHESGDTTKTDSDSVLY